MNSADKHILWASVICVLASLIALVVMQAQNPHDFAAPLGVVAAVAILDAVYLFGRGA